LKIVNIFLLVKFWLYSNAPPQAPIGILFLEKSKNSRVQTFEGSI
jgi:hypothetical protein